MDTQHIPVLAERLAEQISLPQEAVVVDATVGQGGHSLLFGQNLGRGGKVIGFDVDPKSLKAAKERLEGLDCEVVLIRANFSEMKDRLSEIGVEKVDLILADLGFCSSQIEDPELGLSFQSNMPLDMRIDQRLKQTAADIVNKYSQEKLADLIYEYGEERGSRRIARFIVESREAQRISSTGQLAGIVSRALSGKKWSRLHPATRTFQALRIAVNDELGSLRLLLESSPGLLNSGGYFAVISFHSLEDRLVKYDFKEKGQNGVYEVVTKKPLTAERSEILVNPRSRSAKLRIARRR